MKLVIDFQIKQGRKIVSRDTKGYKVLLDRIVKKFENINNDEEIRYTLIIQTSIEGSLNKINNHGTTLGEIHYSKNTVYIFERNIRRYFEHTFESKISQIIAHEFGHLYHVLSNPSDFFNSDFISREIYADRFAVEMTKV